VLSPSVYVQLSISVKWRYRTQATDRLMCLAYLSFIPPKAGVIQHEQRVRTETDRH
jgi:hypothetical protein